MRCTLSDGWVKAPRQAVAIDRINDALDGLVQDGQTRVGESDGHGDDKLGVAVSGTCEFVEGGNVRKRR